MDLRFNTSLAEGYKSASQIARVMTEGWLARNMYCPICGEVTYLAEGPLLIDPKVHSLWVAREQAKVKEKYRPMFCFDDLKSLQQEAYNKLRQSEE